MIRPTLILQMNLDESVYSEDVVAEIKRSYSYVAPAVVQSHETGNAAPENIMRFVVKIHRPYWLSSEHGLQSQQHHGCLQPHAPSAL